MSAREPYRTATGQTGEDAYAYELAAIANAERELAARRERMETIIAAERAAAAPKSRRSAERAEFLADIIIGAVEGGTGYWAQVSTYRHSGDPADTTATLHEIDGPDEPGHVVTVETIAKGLTAIREQPNCMGARTRSHILAADRLRDAGEIDSGDADCIVQMGIFGEIVYG